MAVSRWERGISEPPSHTYIEMGNAAGDPLCWYFWGRAGLSKEDLLRVTPVYPRIFGNNLPDPITLIDVQGSGATLQDAPVESMIAAPKDWCPNPSTTSCLRARGSSMSPLISDGYILVVDFAQNNIGELEGKVVIAWHKDKGLTVSRLKRYDHTIVLQSENASYESITFNGKQRWKIVAKVLWWIGKAP